MLSQLILTIPNVKGIHTTVDNQKFDHYYEVIAFIEDLIREHLIRKSKLTISLDINIHPKEDIESNFTVSISK